MTDVKEILRTFLLSKTAVTDLVGQRIYGLNIPEKENTWPAITISRNGGTTPHGEHSINDPNVQIKIWAETSISAEAVYAAVHDALNGLQMETVGSATIKSAYESVMAHDSIDPETEMPVIFCFYRIMI